MLIIQRSWQKYTNISTQFQFSSHDKVVKLIKPSQQKLVSHPLYKSLTNDHRVRVFMENHVFAVYDFMNLVKCLQNHVTCTQIPWRPPIYSESARLINEIVVGEESDHVNGITKSHFEMYLLAMDDIKASTKNACEFIRVIQQAGNYKEAISSLHQKQNILKSTIDFLESTRKVCESKDILQVGAYFYFGREDPIPKMFQEIINNFRAKGQNYKWMETYLQRHIDVDADDHGPAAQKLMDILCEGNKENWELVGVYAQESIQHRIKLWDGIYNEIQKY